MFEIRPQGDNRFAVAGRWDASQTSKASAVLDVLADSAQLDLGELEYISSAGIGVLVKTQLRLQESDRQITLINVQQRVQMVFHFAGLEEFFGIQ